MMFLVTHEHEDDGCFFCSPEYFNTRREAEEYAKKQAESKRVKGYVYVVYDCTAVSEHK